MGVFFVNLGENNEFVVLNDDIQYTNFRDTVINQLYHQNGGTFRATAKEVDGVLMFTLFDKDSDFVRTLNIDRDSLTYVSRVRRGEKIYRPSIGVCTLDYDSPE